MLTNTESCKQNQTTQSGLVTNQQVKKKGQILCSKPAAQGILAFQLIYPLKLHLSYSIQSIQQLVVVFPPQYNFHT